MKFLRRKKYRHLRWMAGLGVLALGIVAIRFLGEHGSFTGIRWESPHEHVRTGMMSHEEAKQAVAEEFQATPKRVLSRQCRAFFDSLRELNLVRLRKQTGARVALPEGGDCNELTRGLFAS